VIASGDVKIIHLKPPVIVRDFATALGLKPFKLISELMEMGIFASMNQSIEEAVAVQIGERHGCLLEIKHRGEAVVPTAPKEPVEKPVEDEAKSLQPRRHPQGPRRRRRGGRNHPAHRRLPGRVQEPQDHLPGHTGACRLQQNARARRQRHRHRGARGGGRRRFHAPD
jgi:hypothetical protein